MASARGNKLPYGSLSRLLLVWVCTEAVRTQSRVIVLGKSLSEFMRSLDVYTTSGGTHTRLRNQKMDRLFNASVSLIYKDERGKATLNAVIADSTEFWWNPKRPNDPVLWEALLHDSTAARVGALFQLLVQDTTAQDFGLPSSAIRLRM